VTALFAAAIDRTRARCLYGPVVTELGDPATYHSPSLRSLLAGEPVRRRLRRRDVIVPGKATGPLVGGNLSVLVHLLGTRFAPKLAGKVLFLEEVGEPAYRLDRMLTQLRSSRKLAGVRAVLLGQFSVPARRRFPPDRPWQEVLEETFVPLGVPVVSGIPAGHCAGKWTLPLGARATVDTAAGWVRFGA